MILFFHRISHVNGVPPLYTRSLFFQGCFSAQTWAIRCGKRPSGWILQPAKTHRPVICQGLHVHIASRQYTLPCKTSIVLYHAGVGPRWRPTVWSRGANVDGGQICNLSLFQVNCFPCCVLFPVRTTSGPFPTAWRRWHGSGRRGGGSRTMMG